MGNSGAGGSSNGGGSQNLAKDFVRAMQLFMGQEVVNTRGQGATKALRVVVSKIGRFYGKNISRFLRVYTSEMEIYQVSVERMLQTFPRAVVSEIIEKVRLLLKGIYENTWARF